MTSVAEVISLSTVRTYFLVRIYWAEELTRVRMESSFAFMGSTLRTAYSASLSAHVRTSLAPLRRSSHPFIIRLNCSLRHLSASEVRQPCLNYYA